MNTPKKTLLSQYDKKLEQSIEILVKITRDSIADNFHTHSSFLGFLDKQQTKEKELLYDWIEKVDVYMKKFGSSGKQIIFLFDIDETLSPYGSNIIRPAGEVIVQYIQANYTNTLCGLCSARGKESVKEFASINPGFDGIYTFSTRDISSDIDEIIADRYGLQTNGSRNKYNAWRTYSILFPDVQFVLIDDLLDNNTLFEDAIALPFDKKFLATKFDILLCCRK